MDSNDSQNNINIPSLSGTDTNQTSERTTSNLNPNVIVPIHQHNGVDSLRIQPSLTRIPSANTTDASVAPTDTAEEGSIRYLYDGTKYYQWNRVNKTWKGFNIVMVEVPAVGTSRKIIVSNGTSWVASTETYAVPGTSGNIMTSDGTNWTSSTPTAPIKKYVASDNLIVSSDGTVTVSGGSALLKEIRVNRSGVFRIACEGYTTFDGNSFTVRMGLVSGTSTRTISTNTLTGGSYVNYSVDAFVENGHYIQIHGQAGLGTGVTVRNFRLYGDLATQAEAEATI